MTEHEWLHYPAPTPMLHQLWCPSWRKLRLWAVACCLRFRSFIAHPDLQHALEVAERFADGRVSREETLAAHEAASRLASQIDDEYLSALRRRDRASENDFDDRVRELNPICHDLGFEHSVRFAVNYAGHPDIRRYADSAASHACGLEEGPSGERSGAAREKAAQAQCDLLRDIFGNPFRLVAVDPDWLVWNDGAILNMARTIYDDRRWELMPSLAEVLNDARCNNPDILEHCRGGGPHVRGCWLIDRLLSKE